MTKSTNSNGFRFKAFTSSVGSNNLKRKLQEEDKYADINNEENKLGKNSKIKSFIYEDPYNSVRKEIISSICIIIKWTNIDTIKESDEDDKVDLSYSDTSITGIIKKSKNINKHNLPTSLIKDLFILIMVILQILQYSKHQPI